MSFFSTSVSYSFEIVDPIEREDTVKDKLNWYNVKKAFVLDDITLLKIIAVFPEDVQCPFTYPLQGS